MRGISPWLEESTSLEGWDLDHAVDGYVCYTRTMTDEEIDLSSIRSIPEPIAVDEMCRAVKFLVSEMGERLGELDGLIAEGRAGEILDEHQLGIGLNVRNTLRRGGFRWSAHALDDCWLKLLLEALEYWRRDKN